MTWLAATPSAVVRACASMLPRLHAEESLTTASRVALGSGTLEPKSARDLQYRWAKTADGGRTKTRKATPEALARVGIGVRAPGAQG